MTVKPMKTYSLSIPPRDAHVMVPAAIVALDGPIRELHVLAASLAFATPRDLCALRALIDRASMTCDSVHLDCPVTADVNNYLARMNFYTDLPDNVHLSQQAPTVRRSDHKTRLIEVCRVSSSEDAQRLADSVWEVAKSHFSSGPIARACVSVIAAATENVLDHAQSPVGAVVAAQSYRTTGLQLAIVDLGLGIPTTLRSNQDYEGLTDLEAVQSALEDHVTSTGIAGRGAGMAEIIDSARRTRNATLVVQSGLASFTVSCTNGVSQTHATRPGTSTPGTWISLALRP